MHQSDRPNSPINRPKIVIILYLILVFMITFESLAFASAAGRAKEAEELYKQEKYGESLSAFSDAQMEDPGNHLLQYNLGNTHYRMNDLESAYNSFLGTAATQNLTLREKAFYNLGNTAYRQGKLDEAIEWYQRALELNPDDEDAKFNLEFVREELKRRINEAQKQPRDQEGQCQQEPQDGQEGEQQPQPQQQQEQPRQAAGGEEKSEEDQKQQDQSGQEQEGEELTQEEAEQWLGVLEEDQKEFLQNQARRGVPRQRMPEKDW